MTRKEFIEKSLIMGIGLPALGLLASCRRNPTLFPKFQNAFSGKIVIVGAGAAGMAAGYLLKRQGIDFQLIEAAPAYGGRLKKATGFADFPIDMGAEWIHTHPEILAAITDKPENTHFGTMEYNPQVIKTWKNGRLKSHNYLRYVYSEWKFKRSTWFDFFEQHIIPEISEHIVLGQPITAINYEAEKVILTTANKDVYQADKVLITTSVKTLQNQQITFQPTLPEPKREAIGRVFMGDGLKLFIEFKEKFYPDILAFGNIFKSLRAENKYVYDAAFGKGSARHILGLFAVNEEARAYTRLSSEQAIIDQFLAELDVIFGGKASTNYIQHIVQNWSEEPYVQGAYSYSFEGDQEDVIKAVVRPVADKIYFAGEALSIDNQATVHGACQSAYAMVARMIKA